TWDDHDNQDGIRPDNISVNLFADGVKIKTTHARKDTGWVYSFNNLPVYKNGKKITYTISETPVEGYTSTTTGFNLTNKHTPASTSVRVVKKWDDKDNQDKIRPNSIQVQLMANNEPSGSSVTLSKDTDWEYTFTNLPVYKAGKKIVYTVTETSTVTGYTMTGNTNNQGVVTITNSHTPTRVPPTPPTPHLAHTGSSIAWIVWLVIFLAVIGGVVVLLNHTRR
ncbi:Cna B-type domain-containing protein, partial [Alloscardovia theropitheci]